MDFGLSGFLSKFESHFGALATKCLLVLLAFTLIVVCVGLIVSTSMPSIPYLAALFPDWGVGLDRAFYFVWFACVAWLAVSAGGLFVTGMEARQLLNEARANVDRSKALAHAVDDAVSGLRELLPAVRSVATLAKSPKDRKKFDDLLSAIEKVAALADKRDEDR